MSTHVQSGVPMRRWILGATLVVAITAGALPMASRSLRTKLALGALPPGGLLSILRANVDGHAEPVGVGKDAASSIWTAPPVTGLDLLHVSLSDTEATAPLADHGTARLTIDPALQRVAQNLMAMHHIPEAAILMMDVATGHVLVYASHVSKGPLRDLCAEASAPAASVFKVVTGASLVENVGVGPDTKQCYSGGEQRVMQADLEDSPVRDRWCATLSMAMGRSLNTVFARMALKNLTPAQLEDTARAFGFGEPLPFDIPVQVSELHFPTDPLGFARTAAGFWNTTLSPLEAAMMSATIARGGEPIRPTIVSEVDDAAGKVLWTSGVAPALKRSIQPATAQALTTMMEHTVTDGTSFHAFHDAKGTPFLNGVNVAGKTGTLTDEKSRRFYTWFMGFAPSKPMPNVRPVSIAVLVVNLPTWRVKANVLAREMLHEYLAAQKVPTVLRPPTRALAARDEGPSAD
jgi:cell division protein FtsI/penicillin-binding protein 2